VKISLAGLLIDCPCPEVGDKPSDEVERFIERRFV
jgi:hypothetical protein